MIYGNYNSRCPSCTSRIEMDPPRWNSMTTCPSCKIDLLVDYDFVVMENEEWDIYGLQILSESIYANNSNWLDLIESQIYNSNYDPTFQ